MAHFAELNSDSIVQRVVVFDGEGPAGEAACGELLGGTWKQTSYTGRIRGHYAAIGDRYDAVADKFISPRPYPSWWMDDSGRWNPPVPPPTDKPARWDEATKKWVVA